jgi:hypothetical protein
MSSASDATTLEAWFFSEYCSGCGALVSGAFCNDEFCRRRFALSRSRTPLFCPIHDPQVARDRLAATMKEVVHCPTCNRNLYGIKEDDLR